MCTFVAFLDIHSIFFLSTWDVILLLLFVCLFFPVLQCFTLFPFFLAPVVVDGDPTKPKKKGKKKVKKTEPTDLSMFDENTPSIFDDPALGQ